MRVPGRVPVVAGFVPLLLAVLLLVPGLPVDGHRSAVLGPTVEPTPAATEYVNLTDRASNWTSDFTSVAWPAGTFRAIQVELTLTNYGDPWDRAEWVDLNNVTLLDVTTLENGSNNNHVQSVSVNITDYEALFGGPGHVWWAAMPNWISPCDSGSLGCWTGVLSFQFSPGPAPLGLPTIVPVLPFTTLTTTGPWANGTLHVAGTYSRGEAVIFQEGQGTDEFWYAQAFGSRELRWQWDNQTVVAALPLPFLNSGGALGGTNDLYEWNGTPAPGTLARPAVEADVTPWLSLLNGSTWYNFTVVDNENSWQIGLALFLWNASDERISSGAGSGVHNSLGAHAGSIQGYAFANLSEPYATESYNLTWSEFLNVSSTTFDVASSRVTMDRVVASTITIQRVSVVRNVFDVRVDTTGAVHTAVFANWTNLTTVAGNSQNASLSENGTVVWTIDGSGGGLLSTQLRAATGAVHGRFSAPPAQFSSQWGWFQNRSAKNGVGTSAPATSVHVGTGGAPLPGRFVVAPLSSSVVRGPVPVELVAAPESLPDGLVRLGNETWAIPANDSLTVNVPSLHNGTYGLNVSSPTTAGWSNLTVPLTVTGWTPPYVPPLTVTASASAAIGEAPWSVTFTGAAQGGTAPYAWAWSFGDEGAAATQNVSHLYGESGTYVAELNVTDSGGRVAQASVDVLGFPALQVSLAGSRSPWTAGSVGTITANVTGGQGPFNYSWSPLPAACSASASTATSCDPSVAGNLSLRVTVTDGLGYTAAAWFNTTIGPAPNPGGSPGLVSLPLLGGVVAVGAVVGAGVAWWRHRGRRGRAG